MEGCSLKKVGPNAPSLIHSSFFNLCCGAAPKVFFLEPNPDFSKFFYRPKATEAVYEDC